MIEFETVTIIDFLLTPFIAAIIYAIARRYRNNNYPQGHPFRNLFLPALTFKLIGAILICLIYVYYYKEGDTINYFYHARLINSSFEESPEKWLNLLFAIPDRFDPDYFEYTRLMRWYGSTGSYTVPQFASVFGLFTFNTFIPTSLLFAALSFTGFWALFVTFAKLYPGLQQ